MRKHIANLDLIRAVAILMVLFYHVFQWLPGHSEVAIFLTDPGEYGVQLFFVLSGFLVGGLYFNERMKYGKVDFITFILRRISRTMPPYFIVLVISYLGVFVLKGEKFDITYLFFFQNYLEEIPYFLVSWSLCVEEHFYAVLPFYLILAYNVFKLFGGAATVILVTITVLLPVLFRSFGYEESAAYGYARTATHFHFDSMGFGVILAWVYSYKPHLAKRNAGSFWLYVVLSIGILFLTNILSHEYSFCVLLLAMAVTFSVVVFSACNIRQFRISSSWFVKIVANSSYAIYLTHTLIIHLVMYLYKRYSESHEMPVFVLALVMLVSTLGFGILFYLLIERPLMGIRDRMFPSRKSQSLEDLKKVVRVVA